MLSAIRPHPLLKGSTRGGVTFVEILIAFVIMAALLLPVFAFLTNSVKETERFYTEAVAISQAKFIMDTVMSQIPWRCIRENNPDPWCRFEDPKGPSVVTQLISELMPKLFGSEYELGDGKYKGDGILTDKKGFKYRIRLRCIDIEDIDIYVGNKDFRPDQLVADDADGNCSLVKKLILEIKWSNHKGKDPNDDRNARNLHLVSFKSDLEGGR